MEKTILAKKVTYDFERMMDGADLVSCSGFGEEMVTLAIGEFDVAKLNVAR